MCVSVMERMWIMVCVLQEQKRIIIGLWLFVNNCMYGMEFWDLFDKVF